MWMDTIAEGESSSEVSDEDTVLLHLTHDGGVNSLLLSDELSWERLLREGIKSIS
jgi:hypothetical protein